MKKLIAAAVFICVFAAGAQAQEADGLQSSDKKETVKNATTNYIPGREGRIMASGEVAGKVMGKVIKEASKNLPTLQKISDEPGGYLVPGKEGRAMEIGTLFKTLFQDKKKNNNNSALPGNNFENLHANSNGMDSIISDALEKANAAASKEKSLIVSGNPKCQENIYKNIKDACNADKKVKPGQNIPLEKYPRHRELKESIGK